VYVQGDIADDGDAQKVVAKAVEHYGRLDVLVNNAATTQTIAHTDLDAVTDEVWDRILATNVIGTWHMVRAAVPHLRATGDGAIVNVGSRAGSHAAGSSIPYSVSKAGVHHLTLLLARALGPEIRVNAVAPGLIDTPWTEDWHEVRARVTAEAPLRRVGHPFDVADAVLGLVNARYVTGQLIHVDGGLSLR
jgi:ketoreductase RED2